MTLLGSCGTVTLLLRPRRCSAGAFFPAADSALLVGGLSCQSPGTNVNDCAGRLLFWPAGRTQLRRDGTFASVHALVWFCGEHCANGSGCVLRVDAFFCACSCLNHTNNALASNGNARHVPGTRQSVGLGVEMRLAAKVHLLSCHPIKSWCTLVFAPL